MKRKPNEIVPQKPKRGKKGTLAALEKKKLQFLEIWSDPMDNRVSLEELSDVLKVEPALLAKWRLEPKFYELATEKFTKSLRSNIIPIVKSLLTQVEKYRSVSAAKMLLELLGMLQSKGVTVNINPANVPRDDYVSQLSDDELNEEILKFADDSFPKDLEWLRSRVIPIEPALEVEFEEIED